MRDLKVEELYSLGFHFEPVKDRANLIAIYYGDQFLEIVPSSLKLGKVCTIVSDILRMWRKDSASWDEILKPFDKISWWDRHIEGIKG